jgi:hypothetical protein
MSFEQFKKAMEERHKANVADFDIPERIVTQDDVKIWRVSGVVVDDVKRHERFWWPEVVPVVDGLDGSGEPIGAATLTLNGNSIVAHASVDYNTPQRLDFGNGTDLFFSFMEDYAHPDYPDCTRINSLYLDNDPKSDEYVYCSGDPVYEED